MARIFTNSQAAGVGRFASIRELGQPGRMVIRAAGQKNLLTIVTDGELSSDTLFAA
jgi:hypothetical protein